MFDSFFRRKDDEERVRQAGRLPPGQSLTQKFPVLHYGPTPGLTRQPGIFGYGEKSKKMCTGTGRSSTACRVPSW